MLYKEKNIKIPIYTGYLKVVLSDDFEHVCKKWDVDIDAAKSAAFVWTYNNGGFVFCASFGPNVKLSEVVHECVHLCSNIYDAHGIRPDIHNDEPQAYLTGWLFDRCHKILNKELNGQRSIL